MDQLFKDKRVKHSRTGREGICLGASAHQGWYVILWDNERHIFHYTTDEFKIQESNSPQV